jgi:hypothetical protein
MRSQNLITRTEVNNLKRLMIPMMRVEKAMGNKNELNKIMDGAGAVEELAMRVAGAVGGGKLSGGGPGSLVAASGRLESTCGKSLTRCLTSWCVAL